MTPDPIIRAQGLIQAGKLDEARSLCEQPLAKKPRDDRVLSLLGVIAFRAGRFIDAADFFGRASAIDARSEQHAIDFANSLLRAGRSEAAIDGYHKAMRSFPNSANVVYEAGNGFLAMGRFAEAVDTYRKALGSGRPEIYANLGNALQSDRCFAESIEAYREAIRLKPDYVEPHVNLANALSEMMEFKQAIAVLNRVMQLRPNLPEAYLLLGIISGNLSEDDRAASALQQALRLRPGFAEAELELAKVLLRKDRLDEAVEALHRCIAAKPTSTEAFIFLAHALRESGRHREAAEWARKAGDSDDAKAASTFLFSLNYSDSIDDAAVLKHHRAWAERFADPLASAIRPLENDRAASRRLRIGYLSPNLYDHPVGRFLLPLLKHHDHQAFEIFCFDDAQKRDEVAERLRQASDSWIETGILTDAELADLIRERKIDILVDLAMHSPDNRMLTFARRPAPLQITYLAYAGTTGLKTIDYRLTDPYLDPSPENDTPYVEKSWRLPQSLWCYAPPDAPDVSPLPAARLGYVTFGCLNNFAKVTDQALSAWAEILRRAQESRLILHSPAGSHRDALMARFAADGINADRIQFLPRTNANAYFAAYRNIDICFDTIGYAGGTTTFDALWMGVPVVTLAGTRAIGRGGVSILANLQLQRLIAHDISAYIEIAVQLAADRQQLAEMRANLRPILQRSQLMDANAFTAAFESALVGMWTAEK